MDLVIHVASIHLNVLGMPVGSRISHNKDDSLAIAIHIVGEITRRSNS